MLIYDKVFTAPTGAGPLSVTDAKAHLNVTHTDDDALITALINEAIANFETEAGVLLRVQTREATYDSFPTGSDSLEIPWRPVTSVTSVKYRDLNDAEITLPTTGYQVVEGYQTRIYGGASANSVWPETNYLRPAPITIRYIAGYVTVPDDILGALKIMVAERYTHRGDNIKSPAMPPAAVRVIHLHSTSTPG